MTQSPPNLHRMIPTWACIQGVHKVKVKVYVIRTLLWFHENRFFCHKHDWIATKLAHDGPHMGLQFTSRVCSTSRSTSKVTWYVHFSEYTKIATSSTNMTRSPPDLHRMVTPQHSPHPGCAQRQGQDQRSRDTDASVMLRNVCYTVPSDVQSTCTHFMKHCYTLLPVYVSGSYMYCLHHGMSYSVIDGLVFCCPVRLISLSVKDISSCCNVLYWVYLLMKIRLTKNSR